MHRRHLQFSQEVRKQLIGLCQKNQIPIQSCVNHTEFVRQALAEGMFTNVARLTRDGHYVSVSIFELVILDLGGMVFRFTSSLSDK